MKVITTSVIRIHNVVIVATNGSFAWFYSKKTTVFQRLKTERSSVAYKKAVIRGYFFNQKFHIFFNQKLLIKLQKLLKITVSINLYLIQ